MRAKLCYGCEQVKPVEAFARHPSSVDGLRTRCRDCDALARETWNLLNPRFRDSHRRVTKQNCDPVVYSRDVCSHVASYLERAIDRFESRTGNEAPPYLQALLEIATKQEQDLTATVDQAPEFVQRLCEECGTWFQVRRRSMQANSQRFCGNRCLQRSKAQRRLETDPELRSRRDATAARTAAREQTRRLRRLKTEGYTAATRIRGDLAYLLRLEGAKWDDIAKALGYKRAAGPYLAAQSAAQRRV